MSVLDRLFGKAAPTYAAVDPRPDDCCFNAELMPRWHHPSEMDDDGKAFGWVCHSCGREYLPYQVRNRRLVAVG